MFHISSSSSIWYPKKPCGYGFQAKIYMITNDKILMATYPSWCQSLLFQLGPATL